jgi:hypothetical protein
LETLKSTNPSSLINYLGIKGVGISNGVRDRYVNAIPYLAYWEIYKNYYANKQEQIGMMIDNSEQGQIKRAIRADVTKIGAIIGTINFDDQGTATFSNFKIISADTGVTITGSNLTEDMVKGVKLRTGGVVPLTYLWDSVVYAEDGNTITATSAKNAVIGITVDSITIIESEEIGITQFDLDNIDEMRDTILATPSTNALIIDGTYPAPYGINLQTMSLNGYTQTKSKLNQQGLALKTYQSDIFNNWMSQEWIDGANGINEISAVDTSEGSFTMDALNLAKKVYDMLNRIVVSGGSYKDWLNTVYQPVNMWVVESPIYEGGLSKEVVFQEVVSNSTSPEIEGEVQPIGTLAGRGILGKKHKGGHVKIKIDEPSYIIGIASLTPRVDYSQGNDWDINLKTIDDLHKPALDCIGYQDLITEQMASWDTTGNGYAIDFKSAGKQPAWINYMTNFNRCHGNFAEEENEMFMTLNRRYEPSYGTDGKINGIKDLTTYIDPTKHNYAFAEKELSAMNFWLQIGCQVFARRLMSAKCIPNL